MADNFAYMTEQFESFGFAFSELQKRQFYTFYTMLIEKNRVMNLTAITEFQEVVKKHFLDSLFLNRVVNLEKNLTILDLGTGAGFPGIPLKIAYPHLSITLMDSLNKKVNFLQEVIRELELSGVDAIHARAEELAHRKDYREQYDLCISRAVANLSTLEEYCLPFIHIGGTFVSYKSGEIKEEIQESKKACYLLGGKLNQIYPFDLAEHRRSFVIIDKVRNTPKKYPRKAGTPSKMPLV